MGLKVFERQDDPIPQSALLRSAQNTGGPYATFLHPHPISVFDERSQIFFGFRELNQSCGAILTDAGSISRDLHSCFITPVRTIY